MNKFMRLFAVLLVVAAVVLIGVSLKLGRDTSNPTPPAVSQTATPAPRDTKTSTTYPVVTAASTLTPGEPIRADQLTVARATQASGHHYASIDKVVGRVPAVTIAEGETVNRAVLLDDLSLKLRPGERAMAISVNDIVGVAHRIHPGDYVDVFFSMKHRGTTGSRGRDMTQARLLLPRVRVLAYGPRDLPRPVTGTDKDKDADKNDKSGGGTAVLAVPVDKVNRLLLLTAGQSQAKLMLALRNPLDKGMPDPSLFAQPGPVLKTADRHGKDDAYRQKLAKADNHAYAGISLDGLAEGETRPVTHHVRAPRRRLGHRVDVIRGTERGHITVSQ